MGKELVAVVVGEESGDARAAAVLRELRARSEEVEFFGYGGPRLREFGAIEDWAERAGVVGLWDVLRQYGWFRRKFWELVERIGQMRPRVLLLVDYPGFNLRLAGVVKRRNPEVKVVYYISPQVWAWNSGRVGRMRGVVDLMLCIFPFELEIYERAGVEARYVGHPLVEELALEVGGGVEREEGLLALLPGSREREVKRIFPELLGAAERVRWARPEVRFAASAVREGIRDWMEWEARRRGVEVEVMVGNARDLMRRATAGLVCSGTATLEAALLGLPYGLVYKAAWLTYEVARRVIRVKHLGIVNLLAGRTVVREFLQGRCNAVELGEEALSLLNCRERRERIVAEMREVTSVLEGEGASRRVAEAVLEVLGR